MASGPPSAPAAPDDSFLLLVREACSPPGWLHADWRVEPDVGALPLWLGVRNARATVPGQGWKLHVSADRWSAEAVLRCTLPILLAEDASFKLAASTHALDYLNQGLGGLSQIGKFITVYPHDDRQAVRLAVALDRATRGLHGPEISSDRPLAPGSLVHYRYGSFGGQLGQLPTGELVPMLRGPAGELLPDRRTTTYSAPEWAVDPFVAAGVAVELTPPSPMVASRYLIIATVHRSPHGAVHVAVDLDGSRRCALKQARGDTRLGASGRDAREYLRHEADILARLAPDPRFPAVFELVEQGGDLYLAMEYVEGQLLPQQLATWAQRGRSVPGEQVVAWGRQVARMLQTIHAKGFVYRDLKSPNVVVAADGRLRLLDFELACELGAGATLEGVGTRGYCSPEQFAGQPPAITDDIYALGALLYCMATGSEPFLAPDPFNLLRRPLALMNPTIGPQLARVITRCLDPEPSARYATMAQLEAALAEIGPAAAVPPPAFGGELPIEPEPDARRRYRRLARRLGDTLCQVALETPDGRGRAWASSVVGGGGIVSRDLSAGCAGAVLALAELVAEFAHTRHRAVLSAGARWLASAPRPEGPPLPGLYVGEAGVGAALLRAGQVLGDAQLVAVAEERGRLVRSLSAASPDVFNGTAGRVRFHLLLWDETANPEHLSAAVEAGGALTEAAEEAGEGGLRWRMPPGYGEASGKAYLGYAHGAAGIADVLLDLFEATADERFLVAAQGAARWLARQAVPMLDDDSGANWPDLQGNDPGGALWCHGATGVGRLFLHAARLGALPEAAGYAARAARMVARGARTTIGPTQCHGLAGSIEFLLDMFQATGEHAYGAEARSLARLLEAFARDEEGCLTWSGDSPTTFTPDYLVGYAGVAMCLLRLSNPEHRPNQLSRRGFRYRRATRAVRATSRRAAVVESAAAPGAVSD